MTTLVEHDELDAVQSFRQSLATTAMARLRRLERAGRHSCLEVTVSTRLCEFFRPRPRGENGVSSEIVLLTSRSWRCWA